MGSSVLILVVVLILAIGPPVILGIQGYLRDRSRTARLERMRDENRSVLLTNTRRSLEWDPSVAPKVVMANVVRSLDATRVAIGSLKNLTGGEMKMFTGNMTLARNEATERLRAEARAMGMDAVVNVRYETSMVMPNAVELMAYGTGVRRRGRP